MKSEFTRRDFLKYAAAGAATVAGLGILGGCAQTEASVATPTAVPTVPATPEPTVPVPAAEAAIDSNDWLGTAPGITDDKCNADKAQTADVVVIGAGVAGIAAARAAAEEGASVIVVEQAETITVRGLVFGCVDSRVHKAAGCTYDNMEIVNEVMKRCGNRPNARLWKMWADESGAAYDWFEDALIEKGGDYGQFLEFWPNPPKYDNSKQYYKQYCTGVEFVDWVGAVTVQYDKSVSEGVTYLFSTPAVELIKEDGAIKGVYAKDADGDYIRVSARNGVILATGDYGANEAMVKALCPEFLFDCGKITSIVTSTGYGHRMAIWAGGMMEPSPHAHMCHTFPGMGALGTTATLQLNAKGERYMNEDVPGQMFTNQVVRQPGKFGWQVFDSNWRDMMDNQSISHGGVDIYKMDAGAIQAKLDAVLTEPGKMLFGAETLEKLAEVCGMPVETAIASVARYNELCKNGKDEDFGKRADRMFPIEKGPFFACKSFVAQGVVTAGVVVDGTCKVVDENFDPIPGLWAIGNVGGGRYAIDYPVSPICATSHGTAVTFGKHVGTEAAHTSI